MAGRIRIGEILLGAGVLDRDQLNAALGEQRRWGRPLGATLVKMGFVDERSLVRALASQLSLPVASLEGKRIAPDVLELVPAEIAEEHLVLPLFVKRADRRTTLYLAMEDPGNLAVLDDLAFRTGLQVKPVMMAPSELCEGIDRYYRDAAPGAATRASAEAPAPPPAKPAAGPAPAPAPSAARAEAPAGSAEGTEELVRHFTGGGAPSAGREPSPDPRSAPMDLGLPDPEPDRTRIDLDTSGPAPTRIDDLDASEPELARTEIDLGSSAPDLAPTEVDLGPAPIARAGTEPAPPSAPSPGTGTESDAAHVRFDETALASPPPRTGAPGAAVHPPVESLASYEARTRTILHVLTQLLIEKGVISRDEFHARVSALASVDPTPRRDAD